MTSTNPAAKNPSATPIEPQDLRLLIRFAAHQQRIAVEHGDIELAERAAAVTTWLLDQHLHRPEWWVTSP